MSEKGGRRPGWRKDTGHFLYALPASEYEKLSRMWSPPAAGGGSGSEEPRAWLSAARFGAGPRGRANPQDRLLTTLVEGLDKGEGRGSGEWRELELEGEPVGFDPVVFGQEPNRFFYIPRQDALLIPAIKGAVPPTRWLSCRVSRPERAEDLPEDLRFDLEAFVALRQGRLKIISDPRPGRRLLPSGEPLTRWSQLRGASGCLMAPMEGVACSAMAAEWMNSTLSQMGLGEPGPHWPGVKEVIRMAKRWDHANAAPAGGWDEEIQGELLYCTFCPDWESARVTGLVTRHPARAIQWAEGFASRDADIRLASEKGPRLLSRLWRSRSPEARGALTIPPSQMSLQERESKAPEPAEADVSRGFSPAFDAAWESWRTGKKEAPGAAAAAFGGPLNIKRRIMS